ncbi:MAG: hypothetical protein QW343_01640, partial [Candidatus Norongarragalinales archaeon]
GVAETSDDVTIPAAFFVNNLQASQHLELAGLPVTQATETNAQGQKIETPSSLWGEDGGKLVVYSQQVGVTRVQYAVENNASVLPLLVKVKAASGEEATPGETKLNPKTNEGDEALKCSDDKCCNAEEYASAKKNVAEEAKSVFGKILADIETVYEGNIVDGNVEVFKKALNDAISDYLGKQAAYLVCKQFGVDPLAKLKEKCAQKLAEPNYLGSEFGDDLQTAGFGEIYGDAFLETACDSSILNYAFGFGEAMAPGGTFTDVLGNRLAAAVSPRSGTYYKKSYVTPVDIQLLVVLKRKQDGKQKAGVELYTVRPKDINSPDGVAASGDWIDLEGPTLWKGLRKIQCLVGCSTEKVDVLTGCLAPFFGGVPEAEKPVPFRCKLAQGESVQPKYDYCVDAAPSAPAQASPSPSPSPSSSAPAGGEPTPGQQQQATPVQLDGWKGWENAVDCWNYGEYGGVKCFDSLKLLGGGSNANKILPGNLPSGLSWSSLQPGQLTLHALKMLFALQDANSLFVKQTQYTSFKASQDNAAKPLCFKTWLFDASATGVAKKFFDPAQRASAPQSARQYWVCTPLYLLARDANCVPLDDVYLQSPVWVPTQCKSDSTSEQARCKSFTVSDATQYKCAVSGAQAPPTTLA